MYRIDRKLKLDHGMKIEIETGTENDALVTTIDLVTTRVTLIDPDRSVTLGEHAQPKVRSPTENCQSKVRRSK
jgi:hypothetical protein